MQLITEQQHYHLIVGGGEIRGNYYGVEWMLEITLAFPTQEPSPPATAVTGMCRTSLKKEASRHSLT